MVQSKSFRQSNDLCHYINAYNIKVISINNIENALYPWILFYDESEQSQEKNSKEIK